jgi:hypothetical protein
MYLMDAGAKKYAHQFGGTWNQMFSVSDRQECARRFNEGFLHEYKLGNFNNLLPKKYQ